MDIKCYSSSYELLTQGVVIDPDSCAQEVFLVLVPVGVAAKLKSPPTEDIQNCY